MHYHLRPSLYLFGGVRWGPCEPRRASLLCLPPTGMLPHKTKRGQAALDRLKVFDGIPPPYDKVSSTAGCAAFVCLASVMLQLYLHCLTLMRTALAETLLQPAFCLACPLLQGS